MSTTIALSDRADPNLPPPSPSIFVGRMRGAGLRSAAMHAGVRGRPAHAQIVSGSRDKSIKLWNTIGECKYTIGEPDGHTDWVSCVRFSPVTTNPIIVSAGWDKLVKVPVA